MKKLDTKNIPIGWGVMIILTPVILIALSVIFIPSGGEDVKKPIATKISSIHSLPSNKIVNSKPAPQINTEPVTIDNLGDKIADLQRREIVFKENDMWFERGEIVRLKKSDALLPCFLNKKQAFHYADLVWGEKAIEKAIAYNLSLYKEKSVINIQPETQAKVVYMSPRGMVNIITHTNEVCYMLPTLLQRQ